MTDDARTGRTRRYDLNPCEGFADSEAASYAAVLDELSARLMDLISDLSPEEINNVPRGLANSIGMLVMHMASAEAGWISRATGTDIPQDLEGTLSPGRQDSTGALPSASFTAQEIANACRRVRDEVTKPALGKVTDMCAVTASGGRQLAPRGVLMHLVWHWTYHSGQVGTLRRLAGAGYTWVHDSSIMGFR